MTSVDKDDEQKDVYKNIPEECKKLPIKVLNKSKRKKFVYSELVKFIFLTKRVQWLVSKS